jgi:chromate transporter
MEMEWTGGGNSKQGCSKDFSNQPYIGGLLDGVNAGSLGLMAAVTWQLGKASLIDPLTIVLSLLALIGLLRFRINSVWLIGGGGLAGLIRAFIS